MQVNICGLIHTVIEKEDSFGGNSPMGMIDHKKCVIEINEDMSIENKKETLCHEMVHGMLVHTGYTDLSSNEQFVQALANAIYQGFEIKEV